MTMKPDMKTNFISYLNQDIVKIQIMKKIKFGPSNDKDL